MKATAYLERNYVTTLIKELSLIPELDLNARDSISALEHLEIYPADQYVIRRYLETLRWNNKKGTQAYIQSWIDALPERLVEAV